MRTVFPQQKSLAGLQSTAAEIDGAVGRAQTIVLLGDSITAGNHASSAAQMSNSTGWFAWGNAMAGQPFEVIYNAGVGGETSTKILARVDSDVIAHNPSYCAVLCGQNDPSATSADTELIKNNIITIYNKLKNAGIYTFIVTMTAGDGDTKNKQVQIVNSWIKNYFGNKPSCEIIDLNSVWIDKTNSAGNALSTMMRDSVHPSNNGGFVGGILVASHLAKFKKIDFLPTSALDTYQLHTASTNLSKNPFSIGTAGGVGAGTTGTVGSYNTTYCGTGTMVASLVARSDGYGNDQQLDITSTGSACVGRLETGAITPVYLPKIGEKYYAACEVFISGGAVNLSRVQATLLKDNSVVSADFTAGTGPYDALEVPSGGVVITLKTPIYVLTADASTNFFARFEAYFMGAGSATVKIGRMAIRKVD